MLYYLQVMASHPKHLYTPEQYLALERAATYKSEYCAGEIFAMSGASWEHNLIVTNFVAAAGDQLEKSGCNICAADMRVKTPDGRYYTYPDLLIVCGPPQFEDGTFDTILNPHVIIEVLSPSTENYDRTRKFEDYRKIESLREYIMVAQMECRASQFIKQADGRWTFQEVNSLDDILRLATVNCEIDLRRLYRNIEFPSAQVPEETKDS